MGRPPMRIDLLTRISGVTWEEAWDGREALNYGKQPLFVMESGINGEQGSTGRTKDTADWELLQHDVGQKGSI